MRTIKYIYLLLLIAGMLVASTASANLESRPGGMVYDTDLNITWLADANYAKTSGYDAVGQMNWDAAKAWAANLVYGGYDDWRLPTALNGDGSGPCSYYCTGSEMGHLFYMEIGATAYNTILTGNAIELAKFSNIQTELYWSGTRYLAQKPNSAWYFDYGGGGQGSVNKAAYFYVWPVRSGDVVTDPLPATIWLFGSALPGLVGLRRRKRH